MPDGQVYDQDHDEWVVLLKGRAELDIATERVVLEPGAWLMIPAHVTHRVVSTEHGTVWLAVHMSGTA